MTRPRCFLCFKQLMYVKGKPVYDVYKDADGQERLVHKACLKDLQRERENDAVERMRYRRGLKQ